MLKRWFAPISLALLLAACGGGTPLSLNVTSLNPADGATNVAIDVVLSATFSSAIDADTLDGAFTLAADGGAEVAGTAALSADGRTATFTPDANLAYATAYTATVAGTVATTGGVTLGGEASWSFTTEEPVVLTGSDYAGDVVDVEGRTVVAANASVDLAANVAGGDAPYAFALTSGALPTGMTLDADTGAITGTPTAAGDFTGVVQVTDAASANADLNFSITVVVAEIVGGVYVPYDAPSNVLTPIDLASPFTGGYGDLTFEVTDGALPAAFTTLDLDPLIADYYSDYDGAATYEVDLDAVTGAIAGFTGAVGTFTGTVTATDELGQTATATFELVLGFDLAYVGGTELGVDAEAGLVVFGDKVRVSGVPTLALPDSFPVLYFDLTFDAASTGDVAAGHFTINEGEGAITKDYVNGAVDSTWIYDVTVQAGVVVNEGTPDEGIEPAPDSMPSAPVTFTFTYVAPTIN